jgi:hypothetical protein
LGAPLCPLPAAFGASLSTFIGSLGRCPSAGNGDRFLVALDEDGPKCVSGGNVKQLLCDLRLIMTEFMYYGPAASARPECQDNISVTDLGEFMAVLGESPEVILEGFTWLLPATLRVLGVARTHIRALEVAGEDLLQIHPTINRVSQ